MLEVVEEMEEAASEVALEEEEEVEVESDMSVLA